MELFIPSLQKRIMLSQTFILHKRKKKASFVLNFDWRGAGAVHVIISVTASFLFLCSFYIFIGLPTAGWDAKK